MTGYQSERCGPRPLGRAVRWTIAGLLLSACTGDNLFTGLVGASGGLVPDVQISAPANNAEFSLGDSIDVTASIASQQNITTVRVRGVFGGGQPALTPVDANYSNITVTDTIVSYRIGQLGTTTGDVIISVEATDLLGRSGDDEIVISIQP